MASRQEDAASEKKEKEKEKDEEEEEELGFEEMGLDPRLLKAITKRRISNPTAIQLKAIPLIMVTLK